MEFLRPPGWNEGGKRIRDPVYGFIEVPAPLVSVLDHKLFQRLRWVAQLPLEQLVYPSAQHSRFEHSLGTMWLSLVVAGNLIQNSKDQLQEAMSICNELKNLSAEEQQKQFCLAAAAAGMLHDVGHAPFSHTLEDAFTYLEDETPYDHESVGFHVAMKILVESDLKDTPVLPLLRKVLDKRQKFQDGNLDPIGYLIRQIIDGTIDADKGDYVIRDGYHCGVPYGSYDQDRLWMNVALTPNHVLGVGEKGAMEAWSLRIARYRMHQSVYKHKIRNITDALLIQILTRALAEADPETRKKIIPVNLQSPLMVEEEVPQFTFWSDSNLISSIYNNVESPFVRSRIEQFQKREIGKRLKVIGLDEYPGLDNSNGYKALKLELTENVTSLDSRRIPFSFVIYRPESAPVHDRSVQEEIRVLGKEGGEMSLAEHLGFSVEELTIKPREYVLEIYGNERDQAEILAKVQPLLEIGRSI